MTPPSLRRLAFLSACMILAALSAVCSQSTNGVSTCSVIKGGTTDLKVRTLNLSVAMGVKGIAASINNYVRE